MRLLVTGAGGMLGREVVRAAESQEHEVIAPTHGELDVVSADSVTRCVLEEQPDAVLNCAAYTDVDGAEDELAIAEAVNVDGARNVATAAAEVSAEVVYPSSDYVFDGTKRQPYLESDGPQPRSVYAQSKLAGEQQTVAANPRHYVVRSAWLFGTGRRNFVETMLRLAAERGEVSVVSDQVGCPTYARHLAEGLLRLLQSGSYGIHHMASAGQCSWLEFAEEIFRQAGVGCRIEATTTQELDRPALRPSYSVLATERSDGVWLPEWREGLAEYLAERAE